MEKNKIIFLDIDGVLNSIDYMNSLAVRSLTLNEDDPDYEEKCNDVSTIRDEFGYFFDPRCVNFLKCIIGMTDAKIVISSTWRGMGLKSLQEMWKHRNLPGEIIGYTPSFHHLDLKSNKDESGKYIQRGLEIQEWINKYKNKIDSYCIIDDDDDMLEEQLPFFVKTRPRYGLSYYITMKVINILNKKIKEND